MTQMRFLLILTLTLTAFVVVFVWNVLSFRRKIVILHAHDNPGSPIRAPLTCPRGYVFSAGLFAEPDGSRQNAYVRVPTDIELGPDLNIDIDYLLAGEHVDMGILVSPPRGVYVIHTHQKGKQAHGNARS